MAYQKRATQGVVVKVAHPVYGKEYVQQLDAEEATRQPFDARRWIGYGIYSIVWLCMDLHNIGVKLEEEDKSLLLLFSLPSSFDPLVMALLYNKEIMNYKDIVSVLRSNE